MLATSDTILAVSSPPGRSARGLVRASGATAFDLLDDLLRIDGAGARNRGAYRAQLALWCDLSLPCLALVYPRPGSFTGDDTIELLLPGNPSLLERIIDWLIEHARSRGLQARRAEAGEFTFRGFLNGRLSLTEAEGINAAIRARSDAELRAATFLSSGALGALARSLRDQTAAALALVEAGIDFTDQEDVIAISPVDLHARLEGIVAQLRGHLERATPFESLEAIPWVVLAGPPNAGKSTLYNALLGRERAVISAVAGTTRDVLVEPLSLPAPAGRTREIMLVDMAGLDDSDESFINVEMQRAAARALERAELIIQCIPGDSLSFAQVRESRSAAENQPARISVVTKSDLLEPQGGEGLEDTIRVSAVTGAGLDGLRSAIADRLADRAVSLASDAFALLPRHETSLRSALSHMEETLEKVRPQKETRALSQSEIIAALLRRALDDLGALAGQVTADDILGRIFAGFCIGK